MNTIKLKSPDEIEAMYRANQVVAEALMAMADIVKPGLTTAELDEVARKVLEKHGARSAFLNYPHSNGGQAFPATVCTSVNEIIVHGVPSRDTVLKNGDILSMDFGAVVDGWVGDSALTVPVGDVSEDARRLLETGRECLSAAIDQARDGRRLGDLSNAVQRLAESHGFGVVTEFVGHGIGRSMHEPPPIPNVGMPGTGQRIKVGMVLAIEPMINAGTPAVVTEADGWTARTRDRKLSAHFEHSVAVTPEGPRILSARPRWNQRASPRETRS
ncbi:MAG: type I methionyl aminopeptidase [Deltaproteobacteria bacterium]|nr:type I methionyl aminopeptidase [Deltaproteobacteria bacterium]